MHETRFNMNYNACNCCLPLGIFWVVKWVKRTRFHEEDEGSGQRPGLLPVRNAIDQDFDQVRLGRDHFC